MPSIFERTQWPVGHGGFHTGRQIEQGKTQFSYFYDCGSHAPAASKAAALIPAELSSRRFDVGVISHFDHDHFAAIGHSAPTVLYLPYMTRTDQLLHMLLVAKGNERKMKVTAGIYGELKAIATKSQIVMVSSRETPSDNEGEKSILQPNTLDDPDCAFPVVGHHAAMHHSRLLRFKFFNHHAGDLSHALFSQLITDLSTFSDLTKAPYPDVQALLLDIENNAAAVVDHNAKAFKAVYATLLKAKSVSGITASNLSSLTLMSSCEHRPFSTTTRCSPPQHTDEWRNTGWMLTGDLELKEQVWRPFYEHYASELEDCAVFNLPHHASSIALNWHAMHLLSHELIYLANVNDGDVKHPSPLLYETMDDFSLRKRHSVTETPFSAFTLNVKFYP